MAFVAVPSLASRLLTDFAQSDLGKPAAAVSRCGWTGSTDMTARMRLALCQAWEAPLRAVPMSISLGHRRVAGGAGAAGAAGVAGLC